jgi:hypothetical protein
MERTREKRKRENTFKLILKVACLLAEQIAFPSTDNETNGSKEKSKNVEGLRNRNYKVVSQNEK